MSIVPVGAEQGVCREPVDEKKPPLSLSLKQLCL